MPSGARFYLLSAVVVGVSATVFALLWVDLGAREAAGPRSFVLVTGIAVLAVIGLLATVRAAARVRPITELLRVADALAAGDLSARTRSQRRDELGTLGRALDRMADRLSTHVRTLRTEEARLRTVLDGMVEAVLVTDNKGHVVLTNAALDRLSGTRAPGRTVVETIRSAKLHDAVTRALGGAAVQVDLETRVGDDARFLSAQVSPLPERAGVVAVLHDVTDLKMADRVRRDFVANASHELRTPLTAIRGFTETLRDGVPDDEARQRFLDLIAKHALRLSRLVDDLLVLSRAESPGMNFELGPVRVADAADEVVRGLAAQAEAKRITVTMEGLDDLPAVVANEQALDQILLNLVDNAIKYTPAGGTVSVRGHAAGETVSIDIEDTGPGIPAAHVERIFERFYRVDKGRSRDVGGTGLGLSIVKHMATRLHGDVTVDTRVGRGSRFRVSLRRAV